MKICSTAPALLITLLLILSGSSYRSSIHAQQNLEQVVAGGTLKMKPDEKNPLTVLRQAGVQGDKSYLNDMIASLRQPSQRPYALTVLHALAQLGAIESIPVVDTYIGTTNSEAQVDPDLSNYAIVVKARIAAENTVQNIADTKVKAKAKVQAFYKGLGLTAADLNAAVISFRAPYSGMTTDANGKPVLSFSTSPAVRPVGLYAMRELANMIYHGNYSDYSSLPEVVAVNFKDDYASALKMQLAPLTPPQRVATLIQELSYKVVGTDERRYDLQLAINEGPTASQAAAAELRKMDISREQYNQSKHHSGFVSMFYVIAGVGDQDQKPLIEHFTNDADPWVRHYAQIAYRSLNSQINRETMAAY